MMAFQGLNIADFPDEAFIPTEGQLQDLAGNALLGKTQPLSVNVSLEFGDVTE